MNEKEMKTILIETFNFVAAGYDGQALRFFSNSASHLAACLDLRGDELVLDVATGTGHAALAIAGRLPRGRVTGVDFSLGMLDQARRKAAALNLHNVDFQEQDMQALTFPPGHFDAAVCAFGIFFVENMETQLSNIASLVKPGGQVAITAFNESYFHPLKEMMHDRLTGYGVTKSPQTWKRIASEDGCRELFEQAKLESIRVESKNVGYHLDSAEDWWDVVWNAGFRRLVEQLLVDDLQRFKSEHLQEVQALKTADGIWLDAGVLFTIGTK